MKLANRPSVSSPRMAISAVLASTLVLPACRPSESGPDFDQDGILVGVALAENHQFPADFCIKNVDFSDSDGIVCEPISVVKGSDYNYIQENGSVVLGNNFNGELIYVFRVPFDEFDDSITLSFPDVPEGWELYDGPLGNEPMTEVDIEIPGSNNCQFSGEYCTMPLDNKNNIFVLRASGDAVE